jgi:hypothetical protein
MKMKKENVAAMVLGSSDVQEMLMVSRVRLKELVEQGKLQPLKVLKRESLFWLPEVEKLKKEMLLDSRTNLFKKERLKDAQ